MPSAAKLFQQATHYHQAGRYAEAERDYLEILKSDHGDADALRLLAALYVQIGQPERAVEFFERAHAMQPENAETLNNLGVTLRRCGRLDEAIARYEQSLAADPEFLQARANLITALGELGNELVKSEQWSEAGAAFGKALVLDPENPRLMNNLGGARREQGLAEEACTLYRAALQIKPDYFEAHLNLGNALRDLGAFEEARQSYEAALRLKPDSAAAHNNLGTLLQDRAQWEEALACYDCALAADPHSIDAKTNKAFAHLALGQFREGWSLNEAGLGVKSKRGHALFTERRWDGRELHGKNLLVWCEQGLGDNLQFIRYAALCKQRGGRVMVLAPKPLARLFENCPFIDDVVTEARESDFDWQAAMMSLPHIFETTLETIPAEVPYLFVDDKTRAKWANKLSSSLYAGKGLGWGGTQKENSPIQRKKIGLVWAGNAREHRADTRIIDARRSLGLDLLKPLLARSDIDFYSLQMGNPAAQIDQFGLRHSMIDLMSEVTDMLDTAAIIEQLDLVISVDTSVAHLAGGLGKPVWILSRYDACWRWLRNREDSPWYPSARIFGQKEPGDWTGVIEDVLTALWLNAAR